MYADALPFLRCPGCGGTLAPDSVTAAPDGEWVTGALKCAACGSSFPIRAGIPDMLGTVQPTTPAQFTNDLPLTAWGYERLWRPFALTLLTGQPFPYRRELPIIAALAKVAQGGLIIDLACSNGLYARAAVRAMRPASGCVIGIDRSLPMLEDARRRARAARLPITYLRAEAEHLPVVDGQASAVLVGGSLNEMGDIGPALGEVARVLRPGGRFATMTLAPAATTIGRSIQRLAGGGGIRFFRRKELETLEQAHGLHPVDFQQTGVVMFTGAERRNDDG